MDKRTLSMIQNLVGDINEEDLKYVEYYVSEHLGIFIPSVGFCKYAIRSHHTHPSYSFVLFLSETQSIVPTKIKMLPNHYLVTAMSPQVPHEETETDTFTRYFAIFISKEFYEKHYASYSSQEPEHYVWDQFLMEADSMLYLRKFIYEYENKAPSYENMLEALAVIITNQLVRSISSINKSVNSITEKFEIEKVIEYMHQNFDKKLSNAGLAKIADLSESHFIRIFKKETRTTPIEYLIKVRLEKAKKLLKSNTKNITEVALLCGYSSTAHFSSSFAKYIGITPSGYQNTYVQSKK